MGVAVVCGCGVVEGLLSVLLSRRGEISCLLPYDDIMCVGKIGNPRPRPTVVQVCRPGGVQLSVQTRMWSKLSWLCSYLLLLLFVAHLLPLRWQNKVPLDREQCTSFAIKLASNNLIISTLGALRIIDINEFNTIQPQVVKVQ